jgi:hypothetical protein
MKGFLMLLPFILANGLCGHVEASVPQCVAVRPNALADVKARLADGDPSLKPALNRLVRDAESALKTRPPSVTEKAKVAMSGDKHDYMTGAPYFWPDPDKPDGLPYIRHDGKVNPEVRTAAYDWNRLSLMRNAVETLALAYYFTGNEAYAEHAANILRVWYLSPTTRMNPNLNFAQVITGKDSGRGIGIIEGRNLVEAVDASGLLAGSPAWSDKDRDAMKGWAASYLVWLLSSKNGLDEAGATNNHGTFYDSQVVRLALILGRPELAKSVAMAAKAKRIAVQFKPDGSQPLELKRASSLGYSRFNLEAWFELATMADQIGIDLWHYQSPDGGGIRKALDFLLPYLGENGKKWPRPQIKKLDPKDFASLLREAAVVYGDSKYESVLQTLGDLSQDRMQLLHPAVSPPLDVGSIDRERILKTATAALALRPFSITGFKAELSEGGPNDFYSNGDYWWPNSNKPGGLPYVQRDGQTNPENFNQHRLLIRQLRDAVAALGAAYKITGQDRYAVKAADLLKVFFLDPSTRMNPHLKYAQAIPGVSPGRGIGIIDTLHLIEIPVAIESLEKSKSFPPETAAGMRRWFAEYLDWMITSKNGQDEAITKNNHAVAFWLQVAVFARFTNNNKGLAECRRRFTEVFVPGQMAIDGSFPAELARTKPYAYSIFQLDNMTTLCQVLSDSGEDLWGFELADGRGIRKAVDYLFPYLADKSKWPLKPDVQAWNGWPARQSSLIFAGLAFREKSCMDLWRKLPADPADPEVQRNIAVTQPVIWFR